METPLEKAFNAIMQSELFRLNGPAIDLPEALITLARAIVEDDSENKWSLGECLECSLDSLVVGSYWALSEWHGGQNSDEYAALSRLGDIFSPGMSGPPESAEDGSEWEAYVAVNNWFANKNGMPESKLEY